MFVIKAKHNVAKIMLPDESHLEESVTTQIYGFLNHPAFAKSNIVIMPDCHAGMGSCIGFTMTTNEYVIPCIVGVDIGCGVLSTKLNDDDINLEKLDNFIHNSIASGFSVNAKTPNPRGILGPLMERITEVGTRMKTDTNRNLHAMGSLGGGNHFIEIGIDEEDQKWLTIHSGSRKFGNDICMHHQNKAKEAMKKMFIGAAYHRLEFLTEEFGSKEYLEDMRVATTFAQINRELLTKKILEHLQKGCSLEPRHQIHSVHNYIDTHAGIIRKGAINASKDLEVVIPFNMKDGLILGKGKGNKDWNFSAPHGAGRVLSRKRAKEQLSLEDMQAGMKDAGVFTTSATKNTLDEAPGAYKDKDMIIKAMEDTVEVKKFVKPIYNFKAGA